MLHCNDFAKPRTERVGVRPSPRRSDRWLPLGAATEARVTVILMADRDSTSGAQAYLNVLSIDADLLNKQDKQSVLKKVKEFVKKPLKGG